MDVLPPSGTQGLPQATSVRSPARGDDAPIRSRWPAVALTGLHLVAMATLPVLVIPAVTGRVAAQAPKRPPIDDPFAEELNPFPRGDKEKDKEKEKARESDKGTASRTGQTPRTTGRPGAAAKKGSDAEPSPQLPMPFPEATTPGEPAQGRQAKGRDAEDGEGEKAPRARPRARPMPATSDLMPFPDAGIVPEQDSDSPAFKFLQRAERLDRAGKYDEAKKLILEAINEDPKLPLGYLALGIVTRHMGDLSASVEACSKGLRLDPTDPELFLRRGIAWFHLGRHGIALEDFEDAAGIAFDDPRAELWRGLTLMELERPLEAISAYSSAIRRERTYDLAYLNRGLAYLATNEPGKAEADFDHAIRHDPRDPQAWFNRGVAQARQGEYANAIDSYREALRLDPKFDAARRNLEATQARSAARLRGAPARTPVRPAEPVPVGRPVAPASVLGR